ncbi:PLD nuclease N-terminal domain-containing protein [Rhodococcus phenolicus]|uniref:PLD nuclease N-terminal domain-containing protein n=1 Tax=Rhodococcus phenolicus TaxID=263849 RepID=UPI00082F0CAD|nr:PLD nuclease N-terminal domain-containing protein [Rhodococcus phenolicus]
MPYFGLIVMIVWVGCLIDVICADEHRVRNLPKTLWLIIVIILPMVGSLLWLLIGRPDGGVWTQRGSSRSAASAFPEYDRPGRQAGQHSESDEEFLRRCRERAEQQRRVAREQERRRAEQDGGDTGV